MIKKYNNIILSFKTLIGTAKNCQTRIMVKVEIFVAIGARARSIQTESIYNDGSYLMFNCRNCGNTLFYTKRGMHIMSIHCYFGDFSCAYAGGWNVAVLFLNQLQLDWATENKWIYIIYNAIWDGQEIDMVCFLLNMRLS